MQPYNSFHLQAYTGYSSAYTPSQTPAVDGTPHSVAPVQQLDSTSTAAAQKSKSGKRKRHDKEQDGDDEDDEAKKKAKAKARLGAKTKDRKKQDKEGREFLIGLRDDVAAVIYEMASQGIPDRDEIEQQWELLMELNREIDGNTEKYIWWNGVRPERRGTDRAVPERKKES
jgi:hypothetical protein